MPAGSSAAEEKRRLRTELRALRRALDASALARAAQALRAAAAAFTPLAKARSLAGYVACDGEIDVASLLADGERRGATILLPRRVRPGVVELIVVCGSGALVASGPSGILEPAGPACDPAVLRAPAVLIAPAVALDRRGFRLGRGGGDYDRLLPALRAGGWTIVGVCHAAQLCDALPVEAHDQPVDAILTDAGLVLPQR